MNVTGPKHLSSALEALQRVFFHSFRPRSPHLSIFLLAHHHQVRRASAYQPRGLQPHKNSRLQDEQIRSPLVQIVSEESNTLLPPEPPSRILARIDRKKYFLVQVSETSPESITVCKLMEKRVVHEFERAKAKPVKNRQATVKQLEISWTIDPHDFEHKMKHLRRFLEEGRRVEVLVAKKTKHRRDPSPNEATALLDGIRLVVAEVEGAVESRRPEGFITKAMTMFFQGKRNHQKEKSEKDGGEQEARDQGS